MIYLAFIFVDGVLGPLIEKALKFSIPGLGLLLMLILITMFMPGGLISGIETLAKFVVSRIRGKQSNA